jgi:hypothetical protein
MKLALALFAGTAYAGVDTSMSCYPNAGLGLGVNAEYPEYEVVNTRQACCNEDQDYHSCAATNLDMDGDINHQSTYVGDASASGYLDYCFCSRWSCLDYNDSRCCHDARAWCLGEDDPSPFTPPPPEPTPAPTNAPTDAPTDAPTAASEDVTTECVDGTVLYHIAYDHADATLLQLTAGSCNQASEYVDLRQDAGIVSISIDIANCGLIGSVYHDAQAKGYFQATASFKLGVVDDVSGIEVGFYENTLSAECGVATDYTVSIEYGTIMFETDDAPAPINGTVERYEFSIGLYNDDFSAPISAGTLRAGEMVNVGVEAADGFDMSDYIFAVTTCDISAGSTVFPLFSASQCTRDFIDLSLSIVGGQFRISHQAFILEQDESLTQTLSCNVALCDTRQDDVSACSGIIDTCGL